MPRPPAWLALLSPVPADALPAVKPVASAEQIANGTAGPIDGWQSLSVNLSQPDVGLRHVLITVDRHGTLLSASDHVMFVRETAADGEALVTDHESVGGRFEADGSFDGTHWTSRLTVGAGGRDEAATHQSKKREPTPEEVSALRRIIEDIRLRRGG